MRFLLPLLLLLPACVTAGEFERLAFSVRDVRDAVDNRKSSLADIGEKVDDLLADVEEVAADVEARTSGLISAGEAAGGGSALLILGLAALNQLRDRRRRKRGEPVAAPS